MTAHASQVGAYQQAMSRNDIRRAVAVVGLGGIALIHLLDVVGKMQEVPYMGWMFIGLIVSCLAIGAALIASDDPRAWAAAGALAGATLVGYCLSRTFGLPGEGGAEIGNWSEGLGMASLMIEAIVVLLAASALAQRSTPAIDVRASSNVEVNAQVSN
jgi:hypothetical protein